MNYACALKISVKTVILPTPIGLNRLDFGVQKVLNMGLKCIKDVFDIRFVFEEIDPAKTRVVIHKANIILVPLRRGCSRTPNVGVNQFKRYSGNTER